MTVGDPIKYKSRNRFIFGVPPSLFDAFAEFEALEPSVKSIVMAFRDNLHSAVQVGSIPYQLIHQAVIDQRFNQIHSAERIRAIPIDGVIEHGKDEQYVLRRAIKMLNDELSDGEKLNRIAKDTLLVLDKHLSQQEFSESSDELLRQIIVMIWGAFEILFSDIVRLLLNTNNSYASNLIESKHYRDIILSKSIISEALRQYKFDISRVMGDIFCEATHLDSLPQMRLLADVLFANAELNGAMKNEQLWKIAQQRHLIVHRRGIIDANYLTHTSDTGDIGSRLTFVASSVEADIFAVQSVGITLIKTVITKL